jgi:hypothetical protein
MWDWEHIISSDSICLGAAMICLTKFGRENKIVKWDNIRIYNEKKQ